MLERPVRGTGPCIRFDVKAVVLQHDACPSVDVAELVYNNVIGEAAGSGRVGRQSRAI